jgi:acyl-CoA synthetase (AMP-forming)/AMP-acid ligase II
MADSSKGSPFEGTMPGEQTLAGVLDLLAVATPDKIAIREASRQLTYSALVGWSRSVADWLVRSGLRRGQTVGFAMDNSIEWVVAFLAVTAAGGVAVPMNASSTDEQLRHMLEVSKPQLLFVSARVGGLLEETSYDATDTTDGPVIVLWQAESDLAVDELRRGFPVGDESAYRDLPALGSFAPATADDGFICLWTSGSTGKPKGVVVPQAIVETTWRLCQGLGYTEAVVTIVARSLAVLSSIGGSVIGALLHGGTVVILPELSPADTLRALADYRVSVLAGIPPVLEDLRREPEFAGLRDKLRIDIVNVFGGRPRPGFVRDVKATWGCGTVVQTYGSVETLGLFCATRPNDPAEITETTIGLPLPGYEISLRSPVDDSEVDGRREPGELLVRSGRPTSYLGDDGARSVADDEGWYRTGDLVNVDDTGRLRLLGRKGDVVSLGGVHISLLEVESALNAIEEVRLAVAVLRPNTVGAAEPVLAAVIEPASADTTEAALRALVEQALPREKVPSLLRVVEVGAAWPKTSTAKLDRARIANELLTDA